MLDSSAFQRLQGRRSSSAWLKVQSSPRLTAGWSGGRFPFEETALALGQHPLVHKLVCRLKRKVAKCLVI
jgi:hypothetical protein